MTIFMRRPAALTTASAGLLAAALVSLTGPGATATTADTEPASTPVPIATPDGVVSSYLLNAKVANPGQTRLVERAVAEAGGVVVQSWPQIGVVVAHSDGRGVPRATSPPAPATPSTPSAPRAPSPSPRAPPRTAGAPWGTRRLGLQARCEEGRQRRRRLRGPPPATAADPREGEQWDMQMIKADQAHAVTDGNRNVLVGVLDSGIDRRPPGPGGQHRHRRLGELHRRGSAGHARRPAGDRHHQRPRHPRRRHHRRRPQRRRHRRRRSERAARLGQGGQRRRVHLPRVRRLRVRLGRDRTTWT